MDHNPVLNIFSNGKVRSIQDGGPMYTCMTCGRDVVRLTDQGHESLIHVDPDSLGPVLNPDGTPTDVTKSMLAARG